MILFILNVKGDEKKKGRTRVNLNRIEIPNMYMIISTFRVYFYQ